MAFTLICALMATVFGSTLVNSTPKTGGPLNTESGSLELIAPKYLANSTLILTKGYRQITLYFHQYTMSSTDLKIFVEPAFVDDLENIYLIGNISTFRWDGIESFHLTYEVQGDYLRVLLLNYNPDYDQIWLVAWYLTE
jgi:hypothetical protein